MQTQRRAWKSFQRYNVVNFVVSSCIVVAALMLHLADAKQNVEVDGAHTRAAVLSPCARIISARGAQARKLSTLLAHTQHSAVRLDAVVVSKKQRIQQYDAHLNHLNTLHIDQRCISVNVFQRDQNTDIAYNMSIVTHRPVVFATPDGPEALARQGLSTIHFVPQKRAIPYKPLPSPSAPHGFLEASGESVSVATNTSGSAGNVFPYGQCTWWANQRYRQLHGIFVPWRMNANAFQWVARAVESGWRVSGTPIVGSIMVLQPGVDGAYGSGHVGIVERILRNGRVIASSMNWGNRPGAVTQASYVLRPGVSFVSSY